MSVLITLPNHDWATNCISSWNKEILMPIIKKKNINHVTIESDGITEFHVTRVIEKKNPRFLVFNGHGSLDGKSICGHDNEPIISLGVNDHLLDSKIVHSFTCCSAKNLGEKSNAEAFIGYKDVFLFWMHRTTTMRPIKDKLAAPQMKSAVVAPFEILKGKSVDEAYQISQRKYQKMIDEYMWNSDKYTTEEMQRVLPFLIWNKQNQKLIGNKNAKI